MNGRLNTYIVMVMVILALAACSSQSPEIFDHTPPAAADATETTSVPLPAAPTSELGSPAATSTPEESPLTLVPSSPLPKPTETPAPTATATPIPEWLLYDGPALISDEMGVQIHLHREDQAAILSQLRELGVGWVKTQVSWKLFQPGPDRFDEELFAELDRFVQAASENDFKVMLGVAKAPEWSRPTTEMDGPPTDYALFQQFMADLAGRYQGQVTAYELWNEPNLQREWNGAPLNAADLVNLIRAGAAGVRSADPEAILISAAPATTGINDGVVAIDDRQYLQQMVAAGVTDVVDAIGAHPYGWANPPDSSIHDGEQITSSHNNHPSFFFADTLSDYRRILDEAGKTQMSIWVTEFGWGSYDGLDREPPEGLSYVAEVSEPQQAIYTRRAFEMAQEQPGIGPLILWNLNFGPTFGSGFAESSYSLMRPDGARRPVYEALVAAPKR